MMDESRVEWDETDPFYRKGSYNGVKIWIRQEDGYINATKIDDQVKRYVKSRNWQEIVNHWLENEQIGGGTNLSPLKNEEKLPISNYTLTGEGVGVDQQGTFIHPDLIHFVAHHYSIEYAFAVKAIMDVVNRTMPLNEDHDPQAVIAYLKEKNDSYEKKIAEQEEEIEENQEKIEQQEEEILKNKVTIRKQSTTIRKQERVIHETGVSPRNCDKLLKLVSCGDDQFFVTVNSKDYKYPEWIKKFVFAASMNQKQLILENFGTYRFENSMQEEVIAFIRGMHPKSEEPLE
jgi:hypothetical protein